MNRHALLDNRKDLPKLTPMPVPIWLYFKLSGPSQLPLTCRLGLSVNRTTASDRSCSNYPALSCGIAI